MRTPHARFWLTWRSGRVIYEWEQTLDEVKIFIKPPPKAKAKVLYCAELRNHRRVFYKLLFAVFITDV